MLLDHLAVAGETLDEARSVVEETLGVPMQPGGEHDVFFTHNMLLGLDDGLYLEAIAINPAAPRPDRARWFDLDRFKGPARLTNWICRSDDLAGDLSALPDAMGTPVDLQRGDLRWQMAVPQDGILPFDNLAPALIRWQTDLHPAQRLDGSGVRLKRLIISHPDARQLSGLLSGRLNDARVIFEVGPVDMAAVFATPGGDRMISG
ncbi:VOC family protein [Roseobacter ponti]|uniref:VOC family protein n=1 Tax=Roseobacter ponti TaxID=1891787 RepID=A0A858SR51_9RHOB|nr:VOC family protein [Roseobacter ponti]QJF50477.1 VOC family protein [Roseobacter ponti]